MAKHDLRFTARMTHTNYGGDYRYDNFTAEIRLMDGHWVGDIDTYGNPESLRAMRGLTITAQRNPDSENPQWYGFQVEMSHFGNFVTLRDAERAVKVLRSVERKMDKLRDQLGYPQDLADYCARVAIAAGATSSTPFGWYESEITYNGTHYRWTNVDGLRERLAKPADV